MDSSDESRVCFLEHEMEVIGRKLWMMKENIQSQKRNLRWLRVGIDKNMEQIEEDIQEICMGNIEKEVEEV